MTEFLLSAAEITVTMSAVILLLILLNRAAGERFTARCRYILWCIVMVRLAIPVGTPFHTALIRLEVPVVREVTQTEAGDGGAAETSVSASDSAESGLQSEIPENSGTIRPGEPVFTEDNGIPASALESFTSVLISETEENIGDPPESVLLQEDNIGVQDSSGDSTVAEKKYDIRMLLKWGAAVYLFVALVIFTVRFADHLYRTKILRSSRRTVSRELNEVYLRQCSECGVRKRPGLYASVKVSSPILFGYFRPCILLPMNVQDPEKASGILRHELIHWKRGDLWIKMICLIVQSIHWINPLVHFAAGKCVREMELSCDEKVLDGLDRNERQEYGMVMLDVVRFCRSRHSGLTTQFKPRRNVVFERFENILDMRRKKRGAVLIAAVILICLSAGMILSCTVQSDNITDLSSSGQSDAGTDETAGGEKKPIDPALVKESFKNDKPVGKVRTVSGEELERVNHAFTAAEKLMNEYRIEYQDMLDCLTAWYSNEEKTAQPYESAETNAKNKHGYTDRARIYREEFLRAAEYLEKQVPGILFCRDDLRILLSADYIDQTVILPGQSETEFALFYRKNGDSAEEMFRIIRLTAEELLPVEEFDLDTTYIACDGQYYYAIQYPYHVKDELRDTVIQFVRNTFVRCNSRLESVTDSRVNSIAWDLKGASYSFCWANIAKGLWQKSDVIHSDTVKGMSAKLVNRILEYMEEGKNITGIQVTGVELNGTTAPSSGLEVPEDLEICKPLAAETMDSYFVPNRYNPDGLTYAIPMGDYTMFLDFLLSESQIRVQHIRLTENSQLPQYDYNTPARELYALFETGKLTAAQLMQYPSVQYDLLQIVLEVMDNVENNDAKNREGYSVVTLPEGQQLHYPTQSGIAEYYHGYTDDGIIYIYKCASGIYARIDVTVDGRMEFESLSMGNITDLITDYGSLYAIYHSGQIDRLQLYSHETVAEMGAELVNSVLAAFRRGENPNTLFGGAAYGENMVYPSWVPMIEDVQAERMPGYLVQSSDFNMMKHPYACYRVPLNTTENLDIWFELYEDGMRGICVRMADYGTGISSTAPKANIYQRVREGKNSLNSVIGMGTVLSDLRAVFSETMKPLVGKRFDGVFGELDPSVITFSNGVMPRLLAMSGMGNPALCYSPDGEIIYEVGLTLVSDEQTSRLQASYLAVKNTGDSRFTVLTDCYVEGKQTDCALSLPPFFGFDTVKIHGISESEEGEVCVAELIRGSESVFILADVTETVGKTLICRADDTPKTVSREEVLTMKLK